MQACPRRIWRCPGHVLFRQRAWGKAAAKQPCGLFGPPIHSLRDARQISVSPFRGMHKKSCCKTATAFFLFFFAENGSEGSVSQRHKQCDAHGFAKCKGAAEYDFTAL